MNVVERHVGAATPSSIQDCRIQVEHVDRDPTIKRPQGPSIQNLLNIGPDQSKQSVQVVKD